MRRTIFREGAACGVGLLVVLALVCGSPAQASRQSAVAGAARDGGVCCFYYVARMSGEINTDFGAPFQTVAGQANVDPYRGSHSVYWGWQTTTIGRYFGTTRTGDLDMDVASEYEQISEHNSVEDFDSNGDTWVPETCQPVNVNRPDHKVSAGWAINVGPTKVNPSAGIGVHDKLPNARCGVGISVYTSGSFMGPFSGDPKGLYTVPAPRAKWFTSAHDRSAYIGIDCTVTYTSHDSIGQSFKGYRYVSVDILHFPPREYDKYKHEVYSGLGELRDIYLNPAEQQVADNPSAPFTNPPKNGCTRSGGAF
jgi:hypothetical protein